MHSVCRPHLVQGSDRPWLIQTVCSLTWGCGRLRRWSHPPRRNPSAHGRGTLPRRDYFNREIWRPAISAAQLPEDTTSHDLRHTFASTALAEGVPISEVSRWFGHKSITTTVDLYGHLVPEASGRARDALDKAFAGTRVRAPHVPPDATESH